MMALLERVARRLETAPDRAEEILRRVLGQKRDQLQREGSVSFPGVGRFVQTEDGIDFVPADDLAELIDARHAGTGPIPLFGDAPPEASDGPEAAGPEGEERDRIEPTRRGPEDGASEGAPLEGAEESRADEELEDEEPIWETRSEDPLGEPAGSAYQDASYEVLEEAEEPAPPPEDSGSPEAPPTATDSSGADRDLEEDDASSRRRPSAGGRRSYGSDRRRDSSRQTLAIVAGLLILTGSALILYFLWSPGGGPDSTASAGETAIDTSSAPAAEPASPPSDAQASSAPSLPLDAPLRADGPVDPALGGATWVVGSFTDSARAASVRETYRSDGFRTSVLEGGSGFRVAVGQFSTEDDAETSRGELPSDVSGSAWTLEF